MEVSQNHQSNLEKLDHRSSRRRVTVIIPCMNEEDSIDQFGVALSNLETALSEYEFEFIVVGDGSTDRSVDDLNFLFSERENARVILHDRNRGIAAAIRTGLNAATTEICSSMDFDCTYDPLQFANLLPALTPTVDLVTASPYHPDGTVLNVPPWRLLISRFASAMYRLAMKSQLHTYTSCFRVYRRSALVGIELLHPGFVGVAEMLWQLDRNGARIVEVPATLDVRKFGQSKMRVVEVSLAHLRLLTRILFCRTFGLTTGGDGRRSMDPAQREVVEENTKQIC